MGGWEGESKEIPLRRVQIKIAFALHKPFRLGFRRFPVTTPQSPPGLCSFSLLMALYNPQRQNTPIQQHSEQQAPLNPAHHTPLYQTQSHPTYQPQLQFNPAHQLPFYLGHQLPLYPPYQPPPAMTQGISLPFSRPTPTML